MNVPQFKILILLVVCFATTFASEGRADDGINTQTGASFTNVTSGEIVTTEGLFWNGSWGDYDDDGWLDLFVKRSRSPSLS